MQALTPHQVVEELDRYIIGQTAAKRAVAVAIRNRWRRQQLDPETAHDIHPKNIVMIGPTGVGKTEIARRLAKLTAAPFVKVEASRFTEVGYHGRDTESMVRDLMENAVSLVRAEQAAAVNTKATESAKERLVDLLLPPTPTTGEASSGRVSTDESEQRRTHTRARLLEQLDAGTLDDREVELSISHKPTPSVVLANMGMDQMDPDMAGFLDRLIPEQQKSTKVTVAQARRVLLDQETDRLIDPDKLSTDALERAEQSGIIFIDEIDKIASPSGDASGSGSGRGGPDVSRQGVQRDLLPIVEGASVNTRHGLVNTDHILFIAAGAFHTASVSDLMPELQGRFPIRVELSPLTEQDFVRILTEPDNALTKQQQALLGVEGLRIIFDDDAVNALAKLAARANTDLENIGARRLVTVIERVFEQINFDAPQMAATGETEITITEQFVVDQVTPLLADPDLSRFVL